MRAWLKWRPRPDELGWLAIAAATANAVLLYATLRCLGDLIMKRLPLIAALGAIALIGGCATPSFADYAAAANDLDPGCYKDVQVQATPILVFGWPIPILSGTYRKICNADQAPASAALPAPQVGQVVPLT